MTQLHYTFNLHEMTAMDFALIAEASKQNSLLAILTIAGKYSDVDIQTLPFSELHRFMDSFGAALAEWHDRQRLQDAFAALRKRQT